MTPTDQLDTPSGHTPEGGVVVGNANARHEMVVYEDPQCPFCRQFEELNGPLLRAAVGAGSLAVEYRMRCFLGAESVRADNALALAAEADRFDQLRQALFSAQPPEGSGGFTIEDLVRIGVVAVDFVDDDNGLGAGFEGFAEDEAGLGLRTVGAVNDEEDAVDHVHDALDFAAEIGVAGGIHDVDVVILVFEGGVFGADGDAFLAFEVHRVHNAFLGGDGLIGAKSA